MAQNITYLGTDYASVPQIILPKTGGGSAAFTDVSGTTAIASDVASGKTFYLADGQVAAGTGSSSTQLTLYTLRPDAEIVKTVSWDQMIVEDLELTIPTYSTQAQTLRESSLLDTYTVDMQNYDYYIVIRSLMIPTYSVSTVGKGREEYAFQSYLYELTRIPAGSLCTIIDPTKTNSSNTDILTGQGINREFYWYTASTVALYSQIAYCLALTIAAPSISDTTLSINSGSITIRGNGTYLSSTYFNAITDARVQFKADIYRAPKNNLNIDSWGSQHNLNRLIQTVNSNTKDLL